MSEKKERALLCAVLMLFQISFLIFSFDVVITKDANIVETLLPVAVLQVILQVVLFVILLVQFLVTAKLQEKGKVNDGVLTGVLTGIVAVFWAIGIYDLARKNVFSSKEMIFAVIQYVLLLGYAIAHRRFHDRTFQIITSLVVVLESALSIIYAVVYKNEMLSVKRTSILFVLLLAVVLLYIWGKETFGNAASILVVLLQGGISVGVFYRLNHSQHILSVFDKLVKTKTVDQVLSLIVIVLMVLLVITVLLQFISQFQIVGKVVAVCFCCMILMVFNILNGVETEAEGTFEVDKVQTTTTVDYCLYVMKDDAVTSLQEATKYSIGVHYEGNETQMKEAISKLEEAAGVKLKIYEVENLSDLGKAFYNGAIRAAFLDRATAEDIDAEFELIDSTKIFTEDTKIVHTITMDIQVVEDESAPDIHPGGNVSENADLTIEPFVIYLSGIDIAGDITTKSRSDVNVLMAVNPQTKEIALVTTPRDAYVPIPGKHDGKPDKLTHAGSFGISYSIATLEQIYGIPVDYYMRVNFTSMEKIVDLLGGVDVYSHYTFVARHGKYQFVKGMNHMNGSQAVSFARERKTVTGGDVTRGKHHIELVKGIFAKATTTSVLMNYQSLLATVSDNLQTDLSTAQIAALVAMQLSDNAEWHFSSYAATGTGSTQYCASYKGGKLWVSVLHEESVIKAADLMARVLNGEHIQDGEYTYDE